MTMKVVNSTPAWGFRAVYTMCSFQALWILGGILLQVSFITAALPNPPVKLSASEITASSLKLSWNPGNKDDLSYIVEYKAKQDSGQFKQLTGIQKTEISIENMEPYRHYELRAIAVTNSGRSPPSAPLEIVTGEIGAYLYNKGYMVIEFAW